MLRIFLISVLTIICSGCGTGWQFRAAHEPQDGDRARLRGVGTAMRLNQNVCGDNPELQSGMFLGGVFSSSGYKNRSIGMPARQNEEKYWAEMYLIADLPVSVSALAGDGRSSCVVNFIFIPLKDRDYEAIGRRDGRTCSLSVVDITDGSRIPVRPLEFENVCNKD